jgi:hypothetical protein
VTQIGDRVSDLMQTFNTDRRNKESRFEEIHGSTAVTRRREVSWISGLESSEQVDLGVSERNSYKTLALWLLGEINRRRPILT